MRKAIETLLELSPKLNDTTTAANDTVSRVESFLNEKCSVGLPCWILADRLKLEDGPAEHHLWLGYDRIDGKFRIVVEQLVRHNGKEEHLGPKAWASCSRDIKLTTLPKLPKLLDAVAEEATKMAAKNESAIQAVQEILAAMSEPAEPAQSEPRP